MSGFIVGESDAVAPVSQAQDDITRFLTRVLPTPGRGRAIGIHYAFQGAEDKKKFSGGRVGKDGKEVSPMPGRAFYDAAEASGYVRGWLRRMASQGGINVDFYTCMALCGMEVHQADSKIKATRQQAAMMASKALYADLDVKPTAYASQQDAIDHVNLLVHQGKLPAPTVWVSSGSGVHVHWVLDRELNRAEWYALGPAFADYLTTLGVHHDQNVASDGVRVLRLPNTYNCKDLNNLLPTSILGNMDPNDIPVSTFESLLGVNVANAKPIRSANRNNAANAPTAQVILPASFQGVAPQTPIPTQDNFSSGINPNDHVGQPINFDALLDACPTLSDIHDRGGAGDSGLLWNLAILAATFAPEHEARGWAHDFSDQYVGYTVAETDSKFDQKLKDRQTKNLGWPSCRAFSQYSAVCQTCPRLAEDKTPFHSSNVKDNSDLPENYFRQGGHIMTMTEQTINEQKVMAPTVVLPYSLTDAYMEESPDGPILIAHVQHVKNKPGRIKLPIGAATSWKDSAVSALGVAGIALLPQQLPLARTFFVAYIQLLQTKTADVAAREAYGWVESRDGQPGFAYAGRIYYGDGQIETGGKADPAVANVWRTEGSMDAWKQAADLVLGMGRTDIDCMVATAFAAPLVKFSGLTGAIFSAYTPSSGAQKSSALKVAQSVWGDPVKGISKLDDTNNHTVKKLSQLRHLPAYWDEIATSEGGDRFADLGFQLSQGSGKGRMQANTELRETGSWATLLTVAANVSVREIMLRGSAHASGAGVNRTLEAEIMKVPMSTSAAESSVRLGKTHSNYGHAGVLYAALLAREAPTLESRLERVMVMLEKATGAGPDERYWTMVGATILLGAALANQLEGGTLIQFNLKAMRAYVESIIYQQRTARARDVADFDSEDFAVSVIQDYIAHTRTRNECLETNRLPMLPGRPTYLIEMRMPNQEAIRLMKNAVMHIAHDDALVRIQRPEFREWVTRDRKLPFDIVRKTLEKYAGMTEARGRWAAGTPWAGAVQTVYQLDLDPARMPIGARFNYGPKPAPATPAKPTI